MIHRLLFIIFAFCAVSVNAQSDSTKIAIEQINRIKLDSEHYLYSEVTMANWLEAYNAAKALLKEQLATWLAHQKDIDVTSYIARTDEHIFEIKAQRGNHYRAFVYIRKNDVLAFTEQRQLMTVSSDEVKDKAAEETLFKVPETTAASPKEEKLVVLQQTQKYLNAVEKEMLDVRSFDGIEPFISSHQALGLVSSFGKYASRPSSGTYYMFVYNRSAEIPACLRFDDGNITNLQSGKPDSMDSYKNCGAIWFK